MSAEQARTEADAGVAAGTAASADSEEKDVKIPVEDAVETADEKDDAPQTAGATDSIDAEEATMTEDEMVEAAIRAGDLDALCAAAGNALEECSGAKDTGAIKALLREHGAVTALMTGSGAAVFGVFRDEGAARAAAQAAKRRWKQVYVAQPDRGGARVSR